MEKLAGVEKIEDNIVSLTKEATDLIHEEHMVPLCPELGDACRRWQGGDQHSPRELESSEDVRQETVRQYEHWRHLQMSQEPTSVRVKRARFFQHGQRAAL